MRVYEKSYTQRLPTDSNIEKKNESHVSESWLRRWSGLKDLSKAWKSYQRREYSAALKSTAAASFKLGATFAASYGVYKWLAGSEVVYIDHLTLPSRKRFFKI